MRYLLLISIMMFAVLGPSIGQTAPGGPGESPQPNEEAQQTISESEIEERDGLHYRIASVEPYTGKVIATFYGGQKRSETNYKNGKKDGKCTTWHENGGLRLESSYKDGKRDGMWVKRDTNGQIQFRRFYRDGRSVH